MDYESAIYHFSQLDENDKMIVLYEYTDCYYLLNKFSDAINILKNYDNYELSENIIYLKSKIHFKLSYYCFSLEHPSCRDMSVPSDEPIQYARSALRRTESGNFVVHVSGRLEQT